MPRSSRRYRRRSFGLSPIMVMAPLAVFTAVFLWDGGPPSFALPLPPSKPGATDREQAHFSLCSGPVRRTCVIDGDTFWYRGRKIRVADINAPETSEPHCPAEAERGERATRRLAALLNAGAFTLEPVERETDRYGRTLRQVTRGGASLGGELVAEGLAERWKGYRGDWC
jgi:endonuclease YncB( thermonuclease family)